MHKVFWQFISHKLILHKDELTKLLSYSELFSDIGELMIEQFTRNPRARRRMFLTDPWSCFCCASILIDPVSVACGHTACKQCLSKVSQNLWTNVWCLRRGGLLCFLAPPLPNLPPTWGVFTYRYIKKNQLTPSK